MCHKVVMVHQEEGKAFSNSGGHRGQRGELGGELPHSIASSHSTGLAQLLSFLSPSWGPVRTDIFIWSQCLFYPWRYTHSSRLQGSNSCPMAPQQEFRGSGFTLREEAPNQLPKGHHHLEPKTSCPDPTVRQAWEWMGSERH